MPMLGAFGLFAMDHQTIDLAVLFAYRLSPSAVVPEMKE
jgi:hypothetical protein